MADETFFIDRRELARVFDQRAARQFEEMQQRLAETSERTTAGVEATDALSQASFVTLSPNAELENEFVLSVSGPLRIRTGPSGVNLTAAAPELQGDFEATFIVSGPTSLALPLMGTLATRQGAEMLENKTLAAPSVSGLVNAADDTAAGAAGVPVGGVYHDAGALRVRLT